jgi:hypothetical protein
MVKNLHQISFETSALVINSLQKLRLIEKSIN